MSVKTVRRVAARLLGVGESRVFIRPDSVKEAEEALTADDIRTLITEGAVYAGRIKGVPRIRARILHRKKRKGRRGGAGSRKGARYASVPKKELWKAKTRLQRATLKELRAGGRLKEGVYRKAYRMVKGNAWRSRGAMMAHFEDAKWLAPKAEGAPARAKAQDSPAAQAEETK
ncbi:MAG: 50S ribosomal protein L19e [Candidatus ainarchaeum sp.]|nr:50S ribosomal protein L19e [Candidatus ainarchaeum sp.]